ncbi:MAG: fasciclin domain-containing protein, partial [Verrucomicrobiota bacterium]
MGAKTVKGPLPSSFTTLLAAINAADLTEVLEGKGPFTVFAPTDDAFRALPKGT